MFNLDESKLNLSTNIVNFSTKKGYGKSLWLMQGVFKANGGCGYVKKPDFLLKNGPDDEVFDCKRILPVKMTLKVRILVFFLLFKSDTQHISLVNFVLKAICVNCYIR